MHTAFYAVFSRWKHDTAFMSDPDDIARHPAFSDLVGLARYVLPQMIDELRIEPSALVWVLDDALEVQPYPDSSTGNFVEMSNAWIAWFERNRDGWKLRF